MSGELTAADVREALLRLAGEPDLCSGIARYWTEPVAIGRTVYIEAESAARERAALAAEARAEGER